MSTADHKDEVVDEKLTTSSNWSQNCCLELEYELS
jgi:hypothetical protein